jgi:hypothetical protein
MTFLDDFEASYKLQGVRLVSDLLSRVPPELLKRTGVDGLLFTVRHNVLKKYNTFLHPHPSYGA